MMKVFILTQLDEESINVEAFSTREKAEQYIRDNKIQVYDPLSLDRLVFIEEKEIDGV
jgi:hypothetical protein